MPQVMLPTLREGETLEQKMLYLTDNIYKLRKELSFLLGNLDSDNVLEAQSVIADWVYAGGVSANQITAGTISATIGIISPNITGGVITGGEIVGGSIIGGLFSTSIINNNRIEISSDGFYGYNASNLKHGPCINPATFNSNYSELTFYQNGSVQGSLNYSASTDTMQLYALSKLSILATQGTNFFGTVNFASASIGGQEIATKDWVSANFTPPV